MRRLNPRLLYKDRLRKEAKELLVWLVHHVGSRCKFFPKESILSLYTQNSHKLRRKSRVNQHQNQYFYIVVKIKNTDKQEDTTNLTVNPTIQK